MVFWLLSYSTLKMLLYCLHICIGFEKICCFTCPCSIRNGSSIRLVFTCFSLLLVLNNLIVIFYVIVLFMFLILGYHWDSWICRSILFIKFEIFLAIIFLTIYLSPPFSSPLAAPLICRLHYSKSFCNYCYFY